MAQITKRYLQMIEEVKEAQKLGWTFHACNRIPCLSCRQNDAIIEQAMARYCARKELELREIHAWELAIKVKDWNEFFRLRCTSTELESLNLIPQFDVVLHLKLRDLIISLVDILPVVTTPRVKTSMVPVVNFPAVDKAPKSVQKVATFQLPVNILEQVNNNSCPAFQSLEPIWNPKIAFISNSLNPILQTKSFAKVAMSKNGDNNFVKTIPKAAMSLNHYPNVRAVLCGKVTEYVPVANSAIVAMIVGKDHELLKILETLYGVQITNSRKDQRPLFTVIGEKANVKDAKDKILSLDVKYKTAQFANALFMDTMQHSGGMTVKLFVPSQYICYVIGVDGKVLLNIQLANQVKIKTVNKSVNGQLVTSHFSMIGQEECIRRAIDSIVQRLHEREPLIVFKTELFLELKECHIRVVGKFHNLKPYDPLWSSKFN